MKKLILFFSILSLSVISFGQCQAYFTSSANNGTVNFTNGSTGTNLNYSWTFGDGNNSTQMNPSNTYTTTGTYVVCLTIFSNDSINICQDSYCDSIYVVADTTTGSGCNLSSNAYASNGGTSITGTASGASMYHWIVYDNSWSYLYDTNNSSLNYTPGSSGNYNICLTAYDSQQQYCDSICYVVTLQDSTGGGGGNGCNLSSNIYDNGSGTIIGSASGAAIYDWTVYDNSWSLLHNASGSSLSYTPGSAGTYTVCINAYDSLQQFCDSTCTSITLTDTTGGGGSNGCVTNTTITGTPNGISAATTTGPGIFINWDIYDDNGGFVTSSSSNPFIYTPSVPGVYTVCLTAYDSLQTVCDTICSQVATDSTAGLQQINDFVLGAYPNPTQDFVTVNAPTELVSEVILVDLSGTVIYRSEVREESTKIVLSAFPNGMYFIHALGREGQQLSSCRIIKQ